MNKNVNLAYTSIKGRIKNPSIDYSDYNIEILSHRMTIANKFEKFYFTRERIIIEIDVQNYLFRKNTLYFFNIKPS